MAFLFVPSLVMGEAISEPINTALGALWVVGFFSIIFFVNYGIRCPKCKGNLGMTVAWSVSGGSIRQANHCPYCGISLDDECSSSNLQ
jgi:hypothetical protein